MGAGSRHNNARVEYSISLLECFGRMTIKIEQLQMAVGVSTIATALVHTALQGFYSGNLCWKSGHGKWRYNYS